MWKNLFVYDSLLKFRNVKLSYNRFTHSSDVLKVLSSSGSTKNYLTNNGKLNSTNLKPNDLISPKTLHTSIKVNSIPLSFGELVDAAPVRCQPYLKLLRLHQPIGELLVVKMI